MAAFPTLETERLILRRFELTDAEVVQELAGHYEVARTTLHVPHPYPDGAAAEWIRRTQQAGERGSYSFAVVRKADGQLIGCMAIGNDTANQAGEMAYFIGVPYWGMGYATEAARRAMAYGFKEMGLRRIWAAHFGNNPASGRVMQKMGMKYEGTQRAAVLKWGEPQDVSLYGILASEFAE